MGTVQAKEMASNGHNDITRDDDDEREIILSDVPAHVQKIHVDGLRRTKDDIVMQQVKPVFSATNFEEMVKKAEEARIKMERIGLFRKAQVFIDVSHGENAKPDGYEITYNVRESRRVTGGISTLVGTNDGSVMLQVRMPNLFGRAERLSCDYTYGTKSAVGYGASFYKPLGGNPDLTFQAGMSQSRAEFPWSGYKELDRGINFDFSFPSVFGNHNLRWEGVWRDLSCLTNATSFAVREQAGHSLKSSLKHVWERDQRDDRVIPNSGYLLRVSQELAGLGGDAKFFKHDVEFQASKSLILDTVIQMSLAGGVMKSLQPNEDIKICDKFFIGGPLTLRGFNFKGCGPHEDGNALGADTYWLAGLHLYTPLPFRPGRGGFGELFRTHFFMNAGNLQNIDYSRLSENYKENMQRLISTMRWSYGAGVVLKMGGIARLELNYCMPMWAQPGDSTNPGLQFGIGLNFL